MLLGFFLPSVALSRLGRARKKQLTDIGKGGARDAWQVVANGGVATVCAVVSALRHASPCRPHRWSAAFAGAYAAATADTWGTEIGTLNRGTPYSILTLRPVATGLSGGVTIIGTAAEAAGALWIAACASFIAGAFDSGRRRFAGAIAAGGMTGALVDSLLGATVQELRYCPACERHCETDPHDCGTATDRVRGLPGFSNDVVNFAATLSGALTAAILA